MNPKTPKIVDLQIFLQCKCGNYSITGIIDSGEPPPLVSVFFFNNSMLMVNYSLRNGLSPKIWNWENVKTVGCFKTFGFTHKIALIVIIRAAPKRRLVDRRPEQAWLTKFLLVCESQGKRYTSGPLSVRVHSRKWSSMLAA